MKSLKVALGRRIHQNKATQVVLLPWDNDIGCLIVGRPGSGKSHLIATLLTQYAIKGVDIIVAEYNADADNPQSLLYRLQHIAHRYIQPPKTTGDDITALIRWIKQELELRQMGKAERTPLVVVIDEFFQFAASVKPADSYTVWKEGDAREDGETVTKQKKTSFWEDLLASQTDLRKNNIRLILAAQETSSTATSNIMRSIRDMFRFRIIMNLSPKGTDLLGITDRDTQRMIDKLRPGWMYVDGLVIAVPMPINPEWIAQARTLPRKELAPIIQEQQQDWTPEYTYTHLATLHRDNAVAWVEKNVIDKPSLVDILIRAGWSNNAIENIIKGSSISIREMIQKTKQTSDNNAE